MDLYSGSGLFMEVILAKKAGFCFGVERAVNAAFSEADKAKKENKPIYTFGPIIHNQIVVDDLKAQVQNYESSSLKTKVALEIGLPYQMASRLSGSTEEEIRTDAEAMAKLIGSQKPVAPLGSSEPVVTNSKDAAWKKLAAELINE